MQPINKANSRNVNKDDVQHANNFSLRRRLVQHNESFQPPFSSNDEKGPNLSRHLKQQSMTRKSIKGRGGALMTPIITLFMNKKIAFHLVAIVLPCLLSMWYSAAVLFPPEARDKYHALLWTDGHLITINSNDGVSTEQQGHRGGILTLCPRSSICSEGVFQIILIGLARLSAFASYVFMGVTFISKMHFLMRFLSSTYIRTIVPFESLHHVHTNNGKIFAGLAFLHTLTHYIRYILRKDVDQLGTYVHISGLCCILAMGIVILSMSPIAKKFKNRSGGSFDTRIACHWAFVILSIALCFHHGRARTFILICL